MVTPRERERLVRYARKVGPAIKELVSIVVVNTMMEWLNAQYWGKAKGSKPRKPGRPRTPEELQALVIRMLGELKKLRSFDAYNEADALQTRERESPCGFENTAKSEVFATASRDSRTHEPSTKRPVADSRRPVELPVHNLFEIEKKERGESALKNRAQLLPLQQLRVIRQLGSNRS